MKHKIVNKNRIDSHNVLATIQLIPENEMEKIAIQKIEKMEANENEKELVDNYLLFSIKLENCELVNILSQNKTTFSVQYKNL